jgi:hypothetical protein
MTLATVALLVTTAPAGHGVATMTVGADAGRGPVSTATGGDAAPASPFRDVQPATGRALLRAQTWRLRGAVRRLVVGRERRAGYDRDLFGGDWIDADGDCRDTRDEVLAQESRERVATGCDVASGLWRSYYDGALWRNSADVDIDHVVALAEAWDSGARGWSGRTRVRYANDLADRRTLVAVTDNVNQSKGDQDPAEWLPERQVCRYVAQHVAVKLRWSLRVDRPERRTLRALSAGCPNRRITVTRART